MQFTAIFEAMKSVCVCVCVCIVVVLCASAETVRKIMLKAAELHFDNGEYVFINIDLFSTFVFSSIFLSVCLSDSIIVLSLRLFLCV